MHVDPLAQLSSADSHRSAGIHELRFAADAALAFDRPVQLKPGTLARRDHGWFEEASSGNTKVLEYFPDERDEHPSSRVVFIAPIVAALVFGCFELHWAIPGAVAAAMVAWLYARVERNRPVARFTIAGSRLLVTGPRGRELLNVTLRELEAVKLSVRTIEPVFQEWKAGSRAGPYRVGSARDTFRIELVTAVDDIALTEYRTSSIDAEQWLSQILDFLRSNGWTPLDDRGK